MTKPWTPPPTPRRGSSRRERALRARVIAVSASVAAFVTTIGGFAVRDRVAAADDGTDASTDIPDTSSTDPSTLDGSDVYGDGEATGHSYAYTPDGSLSSPDPFGGSSSATPGFVAPSSSSDSFSGAS